jgi:MtrB/PioB family decaheme-associated outer membrane protein
MNANKERFATRCLTLAVRSALASLALIPAAAFAQEEKVLDLTIPKSAIEAGAGYVSDDSAKFGEYNGLNKKGGYGILNFDLRGGGYGSDDPTRWRITGSNLGLDTRNLYGEYGKQGSFRIYGEYDELVKNRSDSYMTPYTQVGGSTFLLPGNWIVPRVPQVSATAGNFRGLDPVAGTANALVNGVSTPPTAAQIATVNNTIATDIPQFYEKDISTQRKRSDAGFIYNIDSRWDVRASISHEDKTGAKLMNFLSLAVGTSAVTLPDPIDQSHDQYNLSVNYSGEKGFFQAAYYGSVFKNNIDSITWQNPFDTTKSSTFSSMPDNQFHQVNATGGYKFSPVTKLVMNASYGRNTQNQQYVNGGESPFGLPANSLNGEVRTTTFNLKLTSRPMKDLNVWAGYKYDDRDNKTPVNIYRFYDAGEAPTGSSPFNGYFNLPTSGANAMGSNINIYENRPYSKKVNQFDAEGDYKVVEGQFVKLAYQFQKIDRKCNGTWTDCVDADSARENTLRGEYRATMGETVNGRVSYAYSERRVDYNPNGWLGLVPMAGQIPSGGATTSVSAFLAANGLGGFGPMAPWVPLQAGNLGIFFPNNSALPQQFYGSRNDIHELPGMERYYAADRNRDKLRSQVDWQATETLGVTGTLDYNNDDYKNSVFGLQKSKGYVANLEGAWAMAPGTSATAFYTYEDRKDNSAGWSYSAGAISNAANIGGVAGNTVVSGGCFSTVQDRNMNAKIDPCLQWQTDMREKVDTFGLAFKQLGLMGGRLDLGLDLLYTKSRTNVGVAGGTYANNPAAVAGKPAVNPAVFFIPAFGLPEVTTKTDEVHLNAIYAINKASSVRLFYWYQRLTTNDFAYQGMQYGTITSVIPTSEKSPSYNVNVYGLSYIYRFR